MVLVISEEESRRVMNGDTLLVTSAEIVTVILRHCDTVAETTQDIAVM